jgi:adenosylmethionine-8-amino-7-oxononanoate aminotransferase
LELGAARETKTPFATEQKIQKKIKAAAFDAGLICYPNGGSVDGKRGDHVLLAPPFIVNEQHIEEIVTKLSMAFKAVL